MRLLCALECITAVLSITLTEAARRATPQDAGGPTLPQQMTALRFNSSRDSIKKGQELGARFPPGYVPGSLHDYHIRFSPIFLRCGFEYQPQSNSSLFDPIFRHIFAQYSDPRYRDHPLFIGPPYYKGWRENSTEWKVKTFAWLGISVRYPKAGPTARAPWPVSRGDFIDIAIWLNQLRLDYPMLTAECGVWKEGRFPKEDLAHIILVSEDAD
ncbi:hypothetical protein XPA_006282 [Xanthoria parietina]